MAGEVQGEAGRSGSHDQERMNADTVVAKTKTPRPEGTRGRKGARRAPSYLAKEYLAARALAREAAFLWTTPDFTALSMADA